MKGNLLVYSTCTNFLDLDCLPHFIFISKL
jgi:hypothetical protein